MATRRTLISLRRGGSLVRRHWLLPKGGPSAGDFPPVSPSFIRQEGVFTWSYFGNSSSCESSGHLLLFPIILFRGFDFPEFSDPSSSAVQKYYMDNPRKRQFVRFKLRAVRRTVMTSHASLLRSAPDANLPFVQRIHSWAPRCSAC